MSEQTQFNAGGLPLPLSVLIPPTTNPRKLFREDSLADLTASIAEKGVLFPLLARPAKGGKFEVICGSRRLKAAQAVAKLGGTPATRVETVPVVVKEISDAEASEIQIVENLQRDDLHFLDEAKAYAELLRQNPSMTPELLAEKVGKSKAYVHQRLSLTRLIPKLSQLAEEEKLSVGVALMLSRLSEKVQEAAVRWLQKNWSFSRENRMTARNVQEFLEREVYVDLKRAPFDTADADLLSKAGPCTTCPKQTGNSPLLFPEIKQNATCSDPLCFREKCQALVALRQKEFPKAVKITHGHVDWEEQKKLSKEIIRESQYGEQGWRQSAAGACEFTKDAVVVAGDLPVLGQHKLICAEPKCPVHATRRSSGERVSRTPGVLNEEKRKQVEQLWQRRERSALKKALHDAVHAKQKTMKTVPIDALRFAVLEAFRHCQLRQDGIARLEESWGIKAGTENWREKLIKDRTEYDLLRLLLDMPVCEDVADPFAQGEQIRLVAQAYKVDLKRITAKVHAEWSEKKRISYAKRDARLKKEREKLARAAEAKETEKKLPAPHKAKQVMVTKP
jgi:ParB family chromosome partitioning protein